MRKVNIAIFASGGGTNCENIIRFFKDSEEVCTALVVSNKAEAPVLRKALKLGVPVQVVQKHN
jgi:phosphoribosylglycinamide formyltransferase-1